MTELAELYKELSKAPFPALGKTVGNFGLYDGYFAGYVEAILRGEPPPDLEALEPDDESKVEIAALRAKRNLTTEEREFLDYVGLMDRIRAEIARRVRRRN